MPLPVWKGISHLAPRYRSLIVSAISGLLAIRVSISASLASDTLRVLSPKPLPSDDIRRARKGFLFPLKAPSLCSRRAERRTRLYPTLSLFKPKAITKLVVAPDQPDWTPDELALLRQARLFDVAPAQEREKIPYKFKYHFVCNEPAYNGHELMCSDCEMGQSYGSWCREYGGKWEQAFRHRYQHEMIDINRHHFLRGNPAPSLQQLDHRRAVLPATRTAGSPAAPSAALTDFSGSLQATGTF